MALSHRCGPLLRMRPDVAVLCGLLHAFHMIRLVSDVKLADIEPVEHMAHQTLGQREPHIHTKLPRLLAGAGVHIAVLECMRGVR